MAPVIGSPPMDESASAIAASQWWISAKPACSQWQPPMAHFTSPSTVRFTTINRFAIGWKPTAWYSGPTVIRRCCYTYTPGKALRCSPSWGMYPFAIWDSSRRRMFLARDPFGIKPLYYADDGGTLRFASQVRALLEGDSIDTSSDAAGKVGFMLWGYVPEPYTLYAGIRALPPGSWMSMDGDGARKRRDLL